MIVKDLLGQCSKEDVAREFLRLLAENSIEERKDPDRDLVPGCVDLINHITSIEPVETDFMLLGGYFIRDGVEEFEAFLIHKLELVTFDTNAAWSRIDSVDNLSDEEIERLVELAVLPETYGCELAPWKETLGYEVNAENISAEGSVVFAATVLYKMTFWGFSEEAVDQERQKIHESLIAQAAILELSPEERKEQVYSAKEMFERFGFRYERTEEEKEQRRRKRYREVLENNLRTYRMIKKYVLL
jgi:hypothetical protein